VAGGIDDIERGSLADAKLLGDLRQADALAVTSQYFIAVHNHPWPAANTAGFPCPGKAGKSSFTYSDAFLPGNARQDRQNAIAEW